MAGVSSPTGLEATCALLAGRASSTLPAFRMVNALASLPGTTLVLDGEVAVFDERLVSRFDLLGESGADVPTTRPVYIAFDVLHARGRDLRARPLEERRGVLERLMEGADLIFPVRRLSADGHKAWEEVLTRGIEGYVGKDPSSTYLSGGPTRSWLKAKVRHESRFVVGGCGRAHGGMEPVAGNDPERRPPLSRSCPFWGGAAARGRAREQGAGALNIAFLGTRTSARRDMARASADGRGDVRQRDTGRSLTCAGVSRVRRAGRHPADVAPHQFTIRRAVHARVLYGAC
jgi:hypothetical protein